MGGPSGGCIPADLIDTPVTYEDINKTGAIVGSGGMIVMDEDTCMVDMARFFLDFTKKESCGKCNYCRIGTKRMLEILERITKGEGKNGDIELLEELAGKIKDGAMGASERIPFPELYRCVGNCKHGFLYAEFCVCNGPGYPASDRDRSSGSLCTVQIQI